ncbi:MAG: endonuclease/exonuclease/phosphatase family protein [Treponemataceae bacterium]
MNYQEKLGARVNRDFPKRSRQATVSPVPTRLSIASFNAENFYLFLDREYSRPELDALDDWTYRGMNTSIYNPNKTRSKIAEIAGSILEHDFDLIGLCEVGGLETLENFNRLYLDSRYECRLYEENSSRGIYVGALVKKDRFPSLRATDMPGQFSRNLLKLDLGEEGGNLEVFVLHLKSQYGEDFGLDRRIEEVDRLCSLVRRRKCVVMGDFNGILIRGVHQFEYERFLELPFYDVLAAVGIPPQQRRTHYYFGKGAHFSQLDYIFCTHDIEVLDAGVLEENVPRNREERNRLPSDHLFIRAMLETE